MIRTLVWISILVTCFGSVGFAKDADIDAYIDYEKGLLFFSNSGDDLVLLTLPGSNISVRGAVRNGALRLDLDMLREAWLYTLPAKYEPSQIDAIRLINIGKEFRSLRKNLKIYVLTRVLDSEAKVLGEAVGVQIPVHEVSIDDLPAGGWQFLRGDNDKKTEKGKEIGPPNNR